MAKRRGRRLNEALITESQALVRALQEQTAVLHAWHPGSMPLSIVVQQLAAFAGELTQLTTEAPADPDPVAEP
jgi:hypothetical protein